MEFVTRYGLRFLRVYYRAWTASPGAIALAAVDEDQELVGVLLGATDPSGHVRAMLRRHGAGLAVSLASYALVHPRLARDLLATRATRYIRGIWRAMTVAVRRGSTTDVPVDDAARRVGEITHLLVAPTSQGLGIGRALMAEAMAEARRAGLDEMVLVTPPDLAARRFYERLGWRADGSLTSRSGEPFIRYRHPLGPTE